MTFGWQSKLARVSRMDWEEVRSRAGQELHKQHDLLMHRMGMRRGSMPLNVDWAARPGQFFFAGCFDSESSASERAARTELLRQHLPHETSEILREADDISRHRFRLLGYENLDFDLNPARARNNSTDFNGNGGFKEIDWHLDPVHGKRAPLNPWFKIPFLDFEAVGDHKIIWELNRHQHLVTLAKARMLSGDEKYVRELTLQWRSWRNANPYPLGINWGSTLEVAFRSLSWMWIDQLLAGTAEYATLRAELMPALAFHGHYIERYLSSFFSPNTHLLGEAVALLFLGTLYPQIPRAALWRESAWNVVLHEAKRQVRPDGVYFEQSLYYHVYALDIFLYARLLKARNGEARNGVEIPPAFDEVLNRMLDVVAALALAGPAEGFGDDDGGRLWNPRRNRTEHMTDPLALGALMYSREFPAARLTEEAIWLFGRPAVDALAQKRPPEPTSSAVQSIAFPDGGVYVLADSQPCAQAIMVDAGPQGEGRSGHGHADALSLRLVMEGRRWLVDSGSGVYISKNPADRNIFRGTSAHNTMRVDGLDQAISDGPFSWTHIPATHAESWITGKTFTYFSGSHNGYARLQNPVVHRRQVLKISGGVCLVRDIALGRAEHELEIRWHFAPDLEVQPVSPGRVEISRAGAQPGESRLALMVPEDVPENTGWQTPMEVTNTQLSPAYGALQPAPMVRCRAQVLLPTEIATVLVPDAIPQNISQNNRLHTESRLVSSRQADVRVYELDYHNQSERFFFALGDQPWSFGPWSSDARVLYCRIENNKLEHLILIGGTYASWQGERLLQAPEPSEFFEWRKQDAVMNSAPREFSVRCSFEELRWESRPVSANFSPNSPRTSEQDSTKQSPSPYAEKR